MEKVNWDGVAGKEWFDFLLERDKKDCLINRTGKIHVEVSGRAFLIVAIDD